MASRQRAFTDSDIARGISLRRCQSSAKGRTKKEDKAMAGVAVNQLDDNDAKDLLLDGISQSVKEVRCIVFPAVTLPPCPNSKTC